LGGWDRLEYYCRIDMVERGWDGMGEGEEEEEEEEEEDGLEGSRYDY